MLQFSGKHVSSTFHDHFNMYFEMLPSLVRSLRILPRFVVFVRAECRVAPEPFPGVSGTTVASSVDIVASESDPS
jgi:hypothetical protein